MVKGLVLAADYRRIFDNRLVVITGVSRSGTSILGKIVGSFDNVIYLYEPLVMRFIPTLAKKGPVDFGLASQLLKGILFEDYYLQLLHGRNLNFKKTDNSYIGNYQNLKNVEERWLKYERRGDILDDIYGGKYLFVLKINEMQPLFRVLDNIFSGIRFIHIIRDGNEVISSSLKRGWYTDEYLNHNMMQWMRPGQIKAPWFIPEKDLNGFRRWNAVTRNAYIWRTLVKSGMEYGAGNDGYLEIRYEELLANPKKISGACERFLRSKRTDVTLRNIISVKRHALTKHSDMTADMDKQEKVNFSGFMKELNYL